MKHLKCVLVFAIAVSVWECGDARFGEKGEVGPSRRRCSDGSSPRRLKKRERRVEDACHRLYPRGSCCPAGTTEHILTRRDARISNSSECGLLLEEVRCARCSPDAQVLFHALDWGGIPALPRLCPHYCRHLYHSCIRHMPELGHADVNDFCQFFAPRDGVCFPDFHKKPARPNPHHSNSLSPNPNPQHSNSLGSNPNPQFSNSLGDDKAEHIISLRSPRKHKQSCYCAAELLGGLRRPGGVASCGDGSQRLFILEREGLVLILTPRLELLPEPFLDIHKLVQSGLKGGDERGLLSLAFHPNYKKNGKLYISYTTNQERWAIGPHDHILRVVEYTVSRKNPNQVDTRTVRMLMEVAELHRKHLGGQLLFGPDGLLHVVLGDGMITLDNMEEMDGLSDFTGSLLRVDVDTEGCAAPYSIPRNNPYFNSTNQPPEILAHGLRDPGRCAVDRHHMDTNGSLAILCTDASGKNSSSGRILEIVKGKDYENEPSVFDLHASGGAAPVGGFIYGGCQSRRLYGSYVFGDRSGNLRMLQKAGGWTGRGGWEEKPLCLGSPNTHPGLNPHPDPGPNPSSSSSCSNIQGTILGFGEDELGEVYILTSSKSMAQSHSAKLYKLVDPKRPPVPKECQRPVEAPELLGTACSRHCRNGHCTPTGTCCCSPGWEGLYCRTARCEPGCRNGGVCVEPGRCLCKSGYSGNQCEKGERGLPSDQEEDGLLDHIIDMTSYLLDLTSYIV